MASPPCHECGEPVQRVEYTPHMDASGTWKVAGWMICPAGHRVEVEPIDDDD